MHWVLQNDIFSETGWTTLVDTLARFGLPHSVHKVVPFVGELVPAPAVSHDNVICFGSYSMRHTAKRYGWKPGVFDLFEQDFPRQLAHWGEHLLNAHARVCRFADATLDGDTFLRPVDDSKCFAGRVFSPAEFEPWQRAVCALGEDDGSTLRADTLVQLCRPTTIHAEYRCWVVHGRVVTQSLYKRGARVFSSPEVAPRIVAFAEARAAEWAPHEAFVLDVCETDDGLRIVEINTLNAAGFYAADVQRLVMVLEAAFSTA